jgi:chromosome segregation ATPase
VDPLDELNQVMEAPYENLNNQIRELKMKLREKDNYLKHAKEELQEWRKKYHILLMDCPEGVQ